MTGCPNHGTGCMCVEHHPGVSAYAQDADAFLDAIDAPVRLEIVTLPSTPLPAEQAAVARLVQTARAACQACNGEAHRCQAGTGPPRFDRLPGCTAWANDGLPILMVAAPQPRQPWEVRPARRRAA